MERLLAYRKRVRNSGVRDDGTRKGPRGERYIRLLNKVLHQRTEAAA